jgi:hypothetical protein
MYVAVTDVAQSRFLDAEMLLEFALANESVFGILGEGADARVSTWHLDELADAFKTRLGDGYEAHRSEQIELHYAAALWSKCHKIPVTADAIS